MPKPEPKEIDEKLALQLKHLAEDSVLKGKPYGDEKCGTCLYYLNTDDDIEVTSKSSEKRAAGSENPTR